jgi:hypothetical protein
MHFGIYVHDSGTTWLDVQARSLDNAAGKTLSTLSLPELDGLFIGLTASKSLASGLKQLKKRVRRNHKLRLITGGSERYKCLVELDALVSDSDLVANADSETKLFGFVQWAVCRCIDMALSDFPHEEAAMVKAAVQSAVLPQEPRW